MSSLYVTLQHCNFANSQITKIIENKFAREKAYMKILSFLSCFSVSQSHGQSVKSNAYSLCPIASLHTQNTKERKLLLDLGSTSRI